MVHSNAARGRAKSAGSDATRGALRGVLRPEEMDKFYVQLVEA
jgi:hypothetical protein